MDIRVERVGLSGILRHVSHKNNVSVQETRKTETEDKVGIYEYH